MKLKPDYLKWAWRLFLLSMFFIVIGIPSCKEAFASAVPKQPMLECAIGDMEADYKCMKETW